MPGAIRVTGWNTSTQCQQISGGGIGIPSVLAQGVINAVDVWGWLASGVEACLRGSGKLLFLDAASSPRTVMDLPAYSSGDMTCAQLTRPGSVVLVQGPPAVPPSPAAPPSNALSGCQVRTTHILNFRDAPAGAILEHLPYDITLTALEYSDGWYKVDYHGRQGWISADYVLRQGNC